MGFCTIGSNLSPAGGTFGCRCAAVASKVHRGPQRGKVSKTKTSCESWHPSRGHQVLLTPAYASSKKARACNPKLQLRDCNVEEATVHLDGSVRECMAGTNRGRGD